MRTQYYITQVTVPEGIGLHGFDKDLTQMALTDLHTTYDENVSVHVTTHKSNWKTDYKLGLTNGFALGLCAGVILSIIIYFLPL